MENKEINYLNESLTSLMRMEYLLEEMIFQQILTRNPTFTPAEANEKLKIALENVSSRLLSRIGVDPDSIKKG